MPHDPRSIPLRHTRQGYRDAAAQFEIMARLVNEYRVALMDAPLDDDFAVAVAEAAAMECEAAYQALRRLAAVLHR
jgi:hypothetical protein